MTAKSPPTTIAGDARERVALEKINAIRNSIIGLQKIDWSEHIYPLVAALGEAGFEGMDYPEARENFGTMLERTVAAEDRVQELEQALSANISAERARMEAVEGWPDIESAPDDGTEFHGGYWWRGEWLTETCKIRQRPSGGKVVEARTGWRFYATHWRPLPPPPESPAS